MATGRRRDEWERTAHLMTAVLTRAPGGKFIDPAKFNPYAVEALPEVPPEVMKKARKQKAREQIGVIVGMMHKAQKKAKHKGA